MYIYGKRIEKALEVYEKTLPTNHPLLAVIHHNISEAYNGLHQHDSVQLQIYKDFLDELGERL